MRSEDIRAITNYIAQMNNITANGNEKWRVETLTKNGIFTSLFLGMVPMTGLIMRKNLSFSVITLSLICIACIVFYLQGRYLKNNVRNNKKKAILVHRITCGIVTIFISLSLPLLYGITLIGGTKEAVIRAIVIIIISVIASIPIGVMHANTCIKKRNGEDLGRDFKQPPFWVAIVIASVFIHALSDDGRTFAITAFLSIVDFYLFYASIIPNCIRLYYTNKYDLEYAIPEIISTE